MLWWLAGVGHCRVWHVRIPFLLFLFTGVDKWACSQLCLIISKAMTILYLITFLELKPAQGTKVVIRLYIVTGVENVWFWKIIVFLVSCSILYLSLNFYKKFLHQICTQKDNKIVLISIYTQTLDLSKNSVAAKKLLIFPLSLTYDFYKFIQC